jgi:Tfp pilus assembly protein PilN
MTTTMPHVPTHATTPPERPTRYLTIAANLLPPEVALGRRARTARRLVLTGLTIFVVMLAGWYGVAVVQTAVADTALRSTQDEATSLLNQQKKYGELVKVQAESRAIQTDLAALLAEDLQWSRLLIALQAAAPSGIRITGVNGTVTSFAGESNSGDRLPSSSKEKNIGTLVISGSGRDKQMVAAYVDALANVPGLANPMLGNATVEGAEVKFNVQLDILASALDGRYTTKQAPKTGVEK